MTRVYGLGRNEKHHYPSYAPKVLLHRVRHRLFGPLLGCSCTRCFNSRWRIVPAREVYADRKRMAEIDRRVTRIERLERSRKFKERQDQEKREREGGQ